MCASTLQSAGCWMVRRFYEQNKGQLDAQNVLPLFQRAMLNLKQCALNEKMAKDNMQNSLSAIWLNLGTFNRRERVLALWITSFQLVSIIPNHSAHWRSTRLSQKKVWYTTNLEKFNDINTGLHGGSEWDVLMLNCTVLLLKSGA